MKVSRRQVASRALISTGVVLAAFLMLDSRVSLAAHHALVVGIDDYQYGRDASGGVSGNTLTNLQGAENDARRVASALRSIDVDLPDSRLLLGRDATLARFKKEFAAMLSDSLVGDTLIITFAGHGGQEKEVLEPIDEKDIDQHDETLMFWDFNPAKPHMGRMVDDELYTLFRSAEDRQIIFVADSCHSGGLTRTIDKPVGLSRQGGIWELSTTLDDVPELDAEEGENWELLRHVTYLTATDDELAAVMEVPIDGVAHGALSVSFAEAIEGKADFNGDGRVLRHELQAYVQTRVRALADQRQTPGFAPRSGSTADIIMVATAGAEGTASQQQPLIPEPYVSTPLPLVADGVSVPKGLRAIEVVDLAPLQFVAKNKDIVAYYNADELSRWSRPEDPGSAVNLARWQWLVDKFRFLDAMDKAMNIRQPPLLMRAKCKRSRESNGHCDGEHYVGDNVEFQFDRHPTQNGEYFVLFNLAGNGELQYLYPTTRDDAAAPRKLPLALPLTVSEPVGRDDLVAMFCVEDPKLLKRLLENSDGYSAPDPNQIVREIRQSDCQVNRLASFSALKSIPPVSAISEWQVDESKAVYGKDDRQEVIDSEKKYRQAARSVAALFSRGQVSAGTSSGQFLLPEEPTLKDLQWCEQERFVNQTATAECTGFLIAPQRMLTSGHCVKSDSRVNGDGLACDDMLIIFDYALSGKKGELQTTLSSEQVFYCKTLLKKYYIFNRVDWAVIEIDRPVQNRPPLDMFDEKSLPDNAELSVIGHPLGLPAKVSDNGSVLNGAKPGYFLTDLDTYEGNSGSPVFVETDDTLQVAGILTGGERDYERVSDSNGGACKITRICKGSSCSGERVTRVTEVPQEYWSH